MASIHDMVRARRTVRKFSQEKIDPALLTNLVDVARFAPSGANMQPLKYLVLQSPEAVAKMFPHTHWAGYIPDGAGAPAPGEEPTAYLVVLTDNEIKSPGTVDQDVGAAIENILLCAAADNIASCWLGSINREGIRSSYGIDSRYTIHSVVALGYPAQVAHATSLTGDVKYYYGDDGDFYVPKRSLDEVLLKTL